MVKDSEEVKISNSLKDNDGKPLAIPSPPWIIMVTSGFEIMFRSFEDFREYNLLNNI